MSVMGKLKAVGRNLPHGTAPPGLVGSLVDKGERVGLAFAFGAAKGYYEKKFIWWGQGGDLWIGLGAAVVSSIMKMGSRGMSSAGVHLERLGDAGLMSWANSQGAYFGMKKAGRSAVMIAPGKTVNALGAEAIGEIPPAMGGAYLSADEIARFAQAR